MTQQHSAGLTYCTKERVYYCHGEWTVSTLDNVFMHLEDQLPVEAALDTLRIDGAQILRLDSAGALAVLRCLERLAPYTKTVDLVNFSTEQMALMDMLKERKSILDYVPPARKSHNVFYNIGKEAVSKLQQIDGFVILIGDLSIKLVAAAKSLKRFHFPNIVSNVYSSGIQALPIIALLSFLIGVVLAYQMGIQLQTYGANIYIAYLSGMAIFREFSPLITAIIVAGRTSSSFTAQIGSMKINEEIDALLTMGLSPVELLVIPKLLGLLIVFPLLIFWSDLFSVFGAMYMSQNMLDVGYHDYIVRLQESVGLKQMMLGLYKAPAFAIIISLVGCYQGFAVQASADNIGSQTTKSVVQALFLIIIADAVFSVIYSWMKL